MACQYTVMVFSSPKNHLRDISIQIRGLEGTSEPQRLVKPVSTISSPHLGLICQVELKLQPSCLDDCWFCDKLYVVTPESEAILFECQRHLDYKNPTVVLVLNEEPPSGTFIDGHPVKNPKVPESGAPSEVQQTEEYMVTADISSLYSDKQVSIQLIGTDDESSPHPLSPSPFKIPCPPLGKLLLVKLVVNTPFLEQNTEWYCPKVTVATPREEIRNFPCYRYLDLKNPVMVLPDDTALIDVPRTHQEIPRLLISQREEELQKRRSDFRWKLYAEGLPRILDADSESDLPSEIRFSLKKEFDMGWTAFKTDTELLFETLFGWKKNWTDLDELKKLLPCDRSKITEYVIQNWDKDEFFGFQLLNGLNPMMIRRCEELPEGSAFTNEMMWNVFGYTYLSDEIKNRNIFICNYERQRDLTANKIHDQQQYLNSPIVLLRLEGDKLIPFAIQVTQDEGKEHTVILNDGDPDKWTLAKTIVRAAEFNEHELNFYLLRTHLLGEVFTVATYRNLPSSHPLFKLLLPHTRYNLHSNILARELLISDKGIFAKYTAIGEMSSMIKFLQRAMSSVTYSSLCLPDDIKERGLEDIPNFYYRDDGTCLWNIIRKFVTDVLQIFYKSDDDVKDDKDLQNWISEIFKFGFNSSEQSEIPSSLRSLEELYKFVTMVIFTVSGQHAAVNNGQMDFGFWLPNFPSTLRAPPPSKDDVVDYETLLKTLPDVCTTINIFGVLKLLSTKSSDHRSIGDYQEELFGNTFVRDKIKEFQQLLKILTRRIKMRNHMVGEPGYTFLSPDVVDNSVAL